MKRLFGILVLILAVLAAPPFAQAQDKRALAIAHAWIDGWNSPTPETLVAAFTRDGVYEDVPFGIRKQGSVELAELHKFFHDAVGGLYCKLLDAHIANGHGTIEWIFGGTDVAVYKTGKPFAVRGVSVIDVRGGKISRNLDY